MSPSAKPTPPERCRPSIRRTRPLSSVVTAFVLMVVAVGVRIGVRLHLDSNATDVASGPGGIPGATASGAQGLRRSVGDGLRREEQTRPATRKEFQFKRIPRTKDSLVLRTDFSDELEWKAICVEIEKPQTTDRFRAHVEFLSDPEYEGITVEQLVALDPKSSGHVFMFIVDRMTLSDAEHPILVVDLKHRIGRTFRVIPSQMWGVENNLSLANMDFDEFADHVDADGIFRDFR